MEVYIALTLFSNNIIRTNILCILCVFSVKKNILELAGPLVYSANEQFWEYMNTILHRAHDFCAVPRLH